MENIMFFIMLFIMFFVAFIAMMIYVIKSVENYNKYTFKGSKCEGKLVYSTKYNIKDCLSLLSTKNVYEVFNYTFKDANGKGNAEIIFTGCNKHLCRSIRTVYLMRFIKHDNGTLMEMVFQNEMYVLSTPCIPEYWVDEFLLQKLEAIRVG